MDRKEAREYVKQLALKQGFTEEKVNSVLQALDDEQLGKLLLDAFVPRPQYSSDLDTRQKERDAALARTKELENWWETTGKPQYEANKAGVAKLLAYEQKFGALEEDSSPEERRQAAKESGLTMKQVEELLDKRLREQGQLYVGLTKDAVRISQDYGRRFNELLDVDALEKFALEKGLPLGMAYEQYIAPRVKEQETKEWEAKVKAAREEGARDARTKHNLPAETGNREPHPLYDQEHLEGKEKAHEDRNSRQEFLNAWNEAAEEVVNQNR